MIVVMESDAPESAIEAVIAYLVQNNFDVHRSSGQTRTILGVVGDVTESDVAVVREIEAVAEVVRVSEPYRLSSRKFRQRQTVVDGDFGSIGGERPWIAIEPIGFPETTADQPPVSLPYALAAGRPFDAAVSRGRNVPESLGSLSWVSLHPTPQSPKWPITFVVREPSWGANKWIGAAERELGRNGTVVLMEAGGEYPNGARTLEVAAIARAKLRTHLPIVVDVPTIAQRARYCAAVASAAIGAGADGVVLRVWVGPSGDLPTQPATLHWEEAVELANKLRAIGEVVRK
ncbi:MAG: hypothetical protein H6718_08325 [Polyangiaceae bacterium]|nr:hypothetical protein [Myxococcales bacterium]MCB9585390.1 hypothetical protein [Polyangiaceae bacterium]MCB9606595.1 hypothetical protein [Polyangiaceae bacterium]